MKALILSTIIAICVPTELSGRVWTDIKGRKIEAEIVRLEDDDVIVSLRGRETRLQLAILSDEDRTFVDEWRSKNRNSGSDQRKVMLLGQELTVDGTVNILRSRMSIGTRKMLGDFIEGDEELEIGISLPPNFDPAKPQKILWLYIGERVTYGPLKRRIVGEIESISETATTSGWVVMAVDRSMPARPRNSSLEREIAHMVALHSDAASFLAKSWSGFKQSQFAFTGNQISCNPAAYWSGHMLRMKYNVIGTMVCINPVDEPERIASETKCDVRELKNLKWFIALNTITDAAANKADIEKGFRRDLERVRFDYRPQPSLPRFSSKGTPLPPIDGLALKAFLDWVVEP